MLVLLLWSTLALVTSDVPCYQGQDTYEYTEDRYPGMEFSDRSRVIRGQYSYAEPRSTRSDPQNTEEVVQANNRHYKLYNQIAAQHQGQGNPYTDGQYSYAEPRSTRSDPQNTEEVVQANNRHYNLFNKIAAQHQRQVNPYTDGQYSNIDPSQRIQTVQYVADEQGFHPIRNDAPDHPKDTKAVDQAKNQHYFMYNRIAEDQKYPYPDGSVAPGAIVDATAYVHPTARVLAGAIIKSYAQVLEHATVESGAIVGENAIVGRHAVVGGGAIMREGSQLRDYSHLAPGQILPPGAVR